MGLNGLRAHVAREATTYRRRVRELKAAGFKEYRSDRSLDNDEIIIECRVGPDRQSVWVKTRREN
jgi:hypothetical protein